MEHMTTEERSYTEELLAGSMLEGFRTLLNPELAREMAKFAIQKVEIFQAYACKQV